MEFRSFPKLILLRPREYRWVNNILKLAKRDRRLKALIITLAHDEYLFKALIKENHSIDSLNWSILLCRHILVTDAKVRKHKLGVEFRE